MAATELWVATGKNAYRDAARKRAKNLNARLTGYKTRVGGAHLRLEVLLTVTLALLTQSGSR